MKKTLDTDKDSIHHYITEHEMFPPWILFKSIYFSTFTNFIDLFKHLERKKIVKRLYDGTVLNLSTPKLCKLTMDTLFICLDYRNIAAHDGRIYSYNSSSRLQIDEIFVTNSDINITGFSKLLFLLSLFRYQSPYRRLDNALHTELSRHCNKFPQDVTYLEQILNINITPMKVAYISENSNKYHFNPYCSGIKNAKQLPLEDIKHQGYIPCKRCT